MRPVVMTKYPVDSHGLIRRESTLRVGINDDAVAAAVDSGDLIRLAPGVYLEARSTAADPTDVYRLRSIAVATSARDRGKTTLSHDSAAAILGLELLHPIARPSTSPRSRERAVSCEGIDTFTTAR